MNCHDALALLLAADPVELEGTATTPLARHLVGCDRCRRVADRLLADTTQLAVAVRADDSRRTAHRRRRTGVLVLGALATAAVAVVLLRSEPAPPPVVTVAPPGVETAAVPAASPTAPPTAEAAVAPPRRIARAGRPDLGPAAAHRLAASHSQPAIVMPRRALRTAAVAGAARSYQPPPAPVEALASNSRTVGRVRVTTPNDVQATVYPTSNPRITVIWIN